MPPLLAGENFEIRYINVGLSWLQRMRRIATLLPPVSCWFILAHISGNLPKLKKWDFEYEGLMPPLLAGKDFNI